MPQSVGIAGGRPSQSYYFFGYQSDSLFYVDPHIAKPSIPFKSPPTDDDIKNHIENLIKHDFHPSFSNFNFNNNNNNTNTNTNKHKSGHRRRKTSIMLNNKSDKRNRSRSNSSATIHNINLNHDLPSPWSTPSTSTNTINDTIKEIPTSEELLDNWYHEAYSSSQINSYLCDKPRKMQLTSMDPSMLLGFVIKDENDWNDWCNRHSQVRKFLLLKLL